MRTRIAAVIPARMNSSRFPGKPLLEVEGLPMVEHVRRRACLAGVFSEVWVATCDEAIRETVERFGGEVRMTSPEHPAATDRVAEAARAIDCTHVVNLQGDELLVLPEDLARFAAALEGQPEIPAWNAVAPLDEEISLADPDVVKCVLSKTGRILLCARDLSRLPISRSCGFHPIRWILGVLAYRKDFLLSYGALERTPLEQAESIDQNRILEHDIPLMSVPFSKGYPGVNVPDELTKARGWLQRDTGQQSVLRRVLAWPGPSPNHAWRVGGNEVE